MTMANSKFVIAGALAASLSLSGCETDPNTGQRSMTKAGGGALAGAGAGALLGGIFGGSTGALIGAGVGSLAGAGVGSYMDKQERDLRAATANTNIQVARVGEELQLNLPDVTFQTGSAIVQPEMRADLQKVAKILNDYPSTVVGIFGHTDNTGSTATNEALSLRRAQSVEGVLQVEGVNPARMRAKGFGYTQPIASNDTPEGRAKNRRVEIRIQPVTKEQLGK
jgi:outer membrane protein OmpA-like peptidoglycan-associated protein